MSEISVICNQKSAGRDEILRHVDDEIDEFEKWFIQSFSTEKQKNEPLLKYERAILKTYLMFCLEKSGS